MELEIKRRLELEELFDFLKDTDYGNKLTLENMKEMEFRYNTENISRQEIFDMAKYIYQKSNVEILDMHDYINIVLHIIAHTEEYVDFV